MHSESAWFGGYLRFSSFFARGIRAAAAVRRRDDDDDEEAFFPPLIARIHIYRM